MVCVTQVNHLFSCTASHCVAGAEDAAAAHATVALPSPANMLQDCDTADDSAAPTVPEAAAAQAEAEASAAAESVRAATLQRLQDIKRRLEQVRAELQMVCSTCLLRYSVH
jgi:hypothetical protein